jgi:hypothetical protein
MGDPTFLAPEPNATAGNRRHGAKLCKHYVNIFSLESELIVRLVRNVRNVKNYKKRTKMVCYLKPIDRPHSSLLARHGF